MGDWSDSCPVTPAEQLALDLNRADPTNHFVKIRVVWLFEGVLDRAAMARALLEVVRRHSMFRTTFREVDGRDHQIVTPAPDAFDLPLTDFTTVPEREVDARLRTLCSDLAVHAFPLDGTPSLRATLVVLAPDRHVLAVVVHHIGFDAGSTRPFFEDLRRCYQALVAADPNAAVAALPAPSPSYVELAEALRQFDASPAGRAQHAYWRDRLATAEPIILPLDAPRDAVDERRAAAPRGLVGLPVAEARAQVPSDLTTQLAALAQQERTSPFILLLAGFAATLHHLTGQVDLCVQSTQSLRSQPKFERTIGFVGNPLLLRVDASGNPTLRELGRRTRNTVLTAWANGRVSIFDHAPHGLRRVNFNYIPAAHNVFDGGPFADGLVSRRLPMESDPQGVRIQFDYNLWLFETPEGIRLRLFYLPELARAATIDQLLARYVEQLGRVVRTPDARLM